MVLTNNFFNLIFVFPILNFLVFLYKGLSFLKIPGALGFSIIGLTFFLRLVLHPFFKNQIETSQKLQQLKPKLDKLARKYKNDKVRLQKEQLKLYQEAGINPAVGCLLPLIQLPIFIGLYQTLSFFLLAQKEKKIIEAINKVVYFPGFIIEKIDPWFFGFNLAIAPSQGSFFPYFLVPLLTTLIQYFQTGFFSYSKNNQVLKKEEKEKDKKNEEEELQKIFNLQMRFIFPLMFGWFSYTLPVGLSLYWNTFSLLNLFYQKKLTEKTFKS